MEIRTFVIPRKNVNRVIVKIIIDKGLDEQIIFEHSLNLQINEFMNKIYSSTLEIQKPSH